MSSAAPTFCAPISLSKGTPNPCQRSQTSGLSISAKRYAQKIRFHRATPRMSLGKDTDREEQQPTESDWREFRAALVAGSVLKHERAKKNAYREGHWAHSLSLPEIGCFLASHPAYYRRSAPYLTQAVVFLTSYSHENGATGLVMNRPLRGTAAELDAIGMFGRSARLQEAALADQPIYVGGPDTLKSGILAALHGNADIVEGMSVRQPLEGVYLEDATEMLRRVPQTDFSSVRLFAGCIRWRKGELESEVDDGSWFCVSASNLYALEHCIQLAKPLWVEIMQSQGQPFAKIAEKMLENESERENED